MNQYVSQGVFDRRVKLIEEKLKNIYDNDLLNRLQAEQEEFIKRLKEIELDGSIPDYFIADYNAFKANTLRIDSAFDSDGQFDGSRIQPNTVSTAALTVGQRSQQLSLTGVEFSVTPYSHSGGYYGTLEWSGGSMFHYGFINKNSEPKVYTITSGSFALGNYAYYIYAYIANPESTTTTAIIKVSTNQIKVDGEGKPNDFPDGYYIQLGYVSVELDSGSSESSNRYYRKVDTTYGQTTINGRLITTGRIEGSGSDAAYFDLDKGEIGGKIIFKGGDNTYTDLNAYLNDKYGDIWDAIYTSGSTTFPLKDILDNMQDQLDGVVDSYFLDSIPTMISTREPIASWTDSYENHEGDTYTDTLPSTVDLTEIKNNELRWIEQGTLDASLTNKTYESQLSDSNYYCRTRGIFSVDSNISLIAKTGISMKVIYYDLHKEYISESSWETGNISFSSISSSYNYFAIIYKKTDSSVISPSDLTGLQTSGDILYPYSAHSWRFIKDGNNFYWLEISDTDTLIALELASEAKSAADGKRRVFISSTSHPTPYTPYDEGDLWSNATYSNSNISYTNEILVCKNSRATGSFDITDWQKSNRATDTADLAIGRIDNVTDDGIISGGTEKATLKREWENIAGASGVDGTYAKVVTAITTFNVNVPSEKSALDSAYSALLTKMNIILGNNDSNINNDTSIESATGLNMTKQAFRNLWTTYYSAEATLNDAIQKAAQDKIEAGVDAAKAELLAIENGTTTIAGGMITNNLLELKNIVGVTKQFKNFVEGRSYYKRISNKTVNNNVIKRFLEVTISGTTYPDYNLYEIAQQGDINTINGIIVQNESATTGTSATFKATEFHYGGGEPGFVTAGLSGIEDFPCYWSGGDEVLARDYIRFKKAWLAAPNTTSGSSYINYVWQNSDLDFIYDWTESTGQGIGTYPIWKKNSSGNVLKANFATSIVRYYIYKREGTRFVTPYDTTPIDTDNDIPRLPVVIIDFDGFCKFGEFCIYNGQAYYNNASGFGHYALTLNGQQNGSGTSLGSFYAPTSAGTNGYILKSNGSGEPSWLNILPVANGGTGTTTFTSGYLLTGNGTSAIQAYQPSWQAWTAGTTAGPKAKIKLGNIDYESSAIPSATSSASGIVTTGNQTFSGRKTMNLVNPHIYDGNSNSSRYKRLYFNNNSDTLVGQLTYDSGNTTNVTTGQFFFDEYSHNSTASTTTTGYYERYRLPVVNSGLSANVTYDILTTKDLSFSITGNAATATTWQNSRTLTIGATGKSVNGSSDVSWNTTEINRVNLSSSLGGRVVIALCELSDSSVTINIGWSGNIYASRGGQDDFTQWANINITAIKGLAYGFRYTLITSQKNTSTAINVSTAGFRACRFQYTKDGVQKWYGGVEFYNSWGNRTFSVDGIYTRSSFTPFIVQYATMSNSTATATNTEIYNSIDFSSIYCIENDLIYKGTINGYTISSTVNSGTANRLAYYTSSGIDDASTTYVSDTKLAINSTSEPSYNLYVNGTADITTSALINNITIGANTISSGSTLYLDSAAGSSIIFRKGTTEMGRWNSSSNLIVGTPSNPNNITNKLYVNGTSKLVGDVDIYNNSGSDISLTLNRNTNASWKILNTSGKLKFLCNWTSSLQSSYSVNSITCLYGSGNVGIGTDSPPQKLSVAGNIYASGGVTALQTVTSDKRFKKNIKKFEAKDIIEKLQPVSFEWNNKAKKYSDTFKDGKNYGLIAQDSDGIIDNLVFDLPDGKGYKGVRYEKLIPILLQAVKEQQKEIDELKSIVKQLKNK